MSELPDAMKVALAASQDMSLTSKERIRALECYTKLQIDRERRARRLAREAAAAAKRKGYGVMDD